MHHIRFLLTCGVLSFAISQSSAAEQAVLPVPTAVAPEAVADRFVDLFKPFRTDQATLSPDGKYIAYSVRENEQLSVVVVEIDNPGKVKTKVTVISDEMATPMLNTESKEKTPAKIRWMRWVTPTRVIVETNRNFPYNLGLQEQGEWINCSGEILGFDADGKNAKSLVTPMDTAEWISGVGLKSNLIPRSPHIVDFHPTDNGAVVIQAEGIPRPNAARYIERYRLNATTGKLSSMAKHSPPIEKAFLFDRSGMPRIAVTTSTSDSFPHPFTYDSGSMLGRWKRLDQLMGSATDKGFELSPENYFGERSIPLGFNLDGTLLYFASNVGRDTYGVYTLDIKQLKRTEFKAESTVFDLFTPAPGVFPDTNGGAMLVRDELPLNAANWEPPLPTVSVPSTDPEGNGRSQEIRQQEADDQRKQEASTQSSMAELSSRIKKQMQAGPLIGNINENPLVYDRYGHDVIGIRYEGKTHTVLWFKPDVKNVQDEMERMFPGCSVDVLEWDSAARRFLIRTRGQIDSGAFYVFDQSKPKLSEFVVRAPWLNRDKLQQATDFSFQTTDGRTISGCMTYPRAARSVPVPVVVLCQPISWERIHADFRPDLQALSEMGFAIIQVNARGCWGFGTKNRKEIGTSFEDAQVADICSSIDNLSRRFAINPRRVAIFGKNLGGYLALRALQIAPTRFKCAVALDSEINLQSWIETARWQSADTGPALVSGFFGSADQLKEVPLLKDSDKITAPILVCSYRGIGGGQETTGHVNARRLVSSVKSNKPESELFELTDDYMANLPKAKAEVFRHIEDFLNINIYNYKVEMGELKQLKD